MFRNLHLYILLKMYNLFQLFPGMGCPQEKWRFFTVKNEITSLTRGMRQCDVVYLVFLLHMTLRETDPQEMQKCYGFGKFNSALDPCGCNIFNFLMQESSRFYPVFSSSMLSFNCSINVNFAFLLNLWPCNRKYWSSWINFCLFLFIVV